MKVLKKSVIAAKGQVEHTRSERAILCEIKHPYIVQVNQHTHSTTPPSPPALPDAPSHPSPDSAGDDGDRSRGACPGGRREEPAPNDTHPRPPALAARPLVRARARAPFRCSPVLRRATYGRARTRPRASRAAAASSRSRLSRRMFIAGGLAPCSRVARSRRSLARSRSCVSRSRTMRSSTSSRTTTRAARSSTTCARAADFPRLEASPGVGGRIGLAGGRRPTRPSSSDPSHLVVGGGGVATRARGGRTAASNQPHTG